MIGLIDILLEPSEKNKVLKQLRKQGYPDNTFKSYIKKSLLKVGSKLADDTGEEIAKNIGTFFSDILVNLNSKSNLYIKTLKDTNDTI